MKTLITLMALIVVAANAQAGPRWNGIPVEGSSTSSITRVTPLGQGHYRIYEIDSYGRSHTETGYILQPSTPYIPYVAPTMHNDLMNQMLMDYLTE